MFLNYSAFIVNLPLFNYVVGNIEASRARDSMILKWTIVHLDSLLMLFCRGGTGNPISSLTPLV